MNATEEREKPAKKMPAAAAARPVSANWLRSKIAAQQPWIEKKHPRLAAYLKRTIKSAGRPTFYAGIVLYPLRLLLGLNIHLFWAVYTLAGSIPVRRRYTPRPAAPDEDEAKIQKVLADLKQYGVAKWEGMFTSEQIREANALMDKLMPRSKEAQRVAARGVDARGDVHRDDDAVAGGHEAGAGDGRLRARS